MPARNPHSAKERTQELEELGRKMLLQDPKRFGKGVHKWVRTVELVEEDGKEVLVVTNTVTIHCVHPDLDQLDEWSVFNRPKPRKKR